MAKRDWPEQNREALGRLVREVWVTWAREQPDPKPHHLDPWERLDEGGKEVDRRIGEAVAKRALATPSPTPEPECFARWREHCTRLNLGEWLRMMQLRGHYGNIPDAAADCLEHLATTPPAEPVSECVVCGKHTATVDRNEEPYCGCDDENRPADPAAVCASAEVVEAVRELADTLDRCSTPDHHSRDELLARNGVWGTCAHCPRRDGEVYPEECQWRRRYDHQLGRYETYLHPSNAALVCKMAATLRDESTVRAEVEKPTRELLHDSGRCGDGDLARMVARALDEASQEGDERLSRAIADACEVVDAVTDKTGTLAERTTAALGKARAEGAAAERERCAKVAEDCHCAAINSDWTYAQKAIAKGIRALPDKPSEENP